MHKFETPKRSPFDLYTPAIPVYSILQPFAFEVKARKFLATYSRLQCKWENRPVGKAKKVKAFLLKDQNLMQKGNQNVKILLLVK